MDKTNEPDNFMLLRPVKFVYKDDPTNKERIGLVAEDVAKLYPEAVYYEPDNKTSPRGINYEMLIPILIQKVQEQQAQLDVLTPNNIGVPIGSSLITQNRDLTKRVSELEAQVAALNQHWYSGLFK
jgi:hypothetical protein